MIHQFIFANPKPGMSVQEFQNYWVNIHAVQYASKIKQIKKYMIDTVIPILGQEPKFQGIAEIWIHPEEQLESLQSSEFLNGARLDEPNWAAFWMTLCLDTNPTILLEGPPLSKNQSWVKETIVVKRNLGIPLEIFRTHLLQVYGPMLLELPDVRRCLIGTTVDGFYGLGEAVFDAVIQLWYDTTAGMEQVVNSRHFQNRIKSVANQLFDPAHRFMLAANENWIIGPEPRP